MKPTHGKLTILLIILIPISSFAQNSPTETGIGITKTWEKDNMEIVFVPAGTFLMGSNNDQLDAALSECSELSPTGNCTLHQYSHEQPAHWAYLDSFWIDKTEVTNTLFCNFLNDEGNQIENGVYWFEP